MATRVTLEDIDRMGGHEFEYLCAHLLRNTGYDRVNVTQASGDDGIDIIAYRDGLKYGFQCKRYSNNVGRGAIQEVYSGAGVYGCDKAVVITNNYFTKPAQETASKLGVELWDRPRFIQLVKSVSRSENNEISFVIPRQASSGGPFSTKISSFVIAIIILFIVFGSCSSDSSTSKPNTTTRPDTGIKTDTQHEVVEPDNVIENNDVKNDIPTQSQNINKANTKPQVADPVSESPTEQLNQPEEEKDYEYLKCSVCGTLNDPWDEMCHVCGNSLLIDNEGTNNELPEDLVENEVMLVECPHCHALIEDNYNQCPNCGNIVSD